MPAQKLGGIAAPFTVVPLVRHPNQRAGRATFPNPASASAA